jgi:hypothetical protein
MKRNTYDKLLLSLAALLLAAAPGWAGTREQALEIDLVAHQSDRVLLTPGQPTQTGTLRIDDADTVTVIFASPSKTLSIELISPLGQSLLSGDGTSALGETRIAPALTDPGAKGANYFFILAAPVPGAWTYHIHETAPLTGPRAVLIGVNSTSPIRAGIVGGGQDYVVDRDVRLALVVADGESLKRDLTITAHLTKAGDPGFGQIAVTFRDDGLAADATAADGMYTATFLPGQTGKFQVNAKIEGLNGAGHPFQRTASAVFNVHPVMARLTGAFTDRGIDTNANTLYDFLGITVQLNVVQAGEYRVAVTLQGSNGARTTASAKATLAAGPASVEVKFRAEDLKRDLAVNGPYLVRDVYVERLGDSTAATVDAGFDLGNTSPWQLSQLERPGIDYLFSGTSAGVDTNADGQFELLDVSLQTNFFRSGSYSWGARLVDVNGVELGLATGGGFFSAGVRNLTLRFNGTAIGLNGVNGPYFVRNLIIFGAGFSTIIDKPLTTQAYLASQFEGYILDTEPPQLTVSVTPTTLWPVNHQMVEITPSIVVTDNRDPNPQVTFGGVTSNEGENAIGDGNTSPDIQVDANGRIFLRAERAGVGTGRVYTLTWSARDAAGNVTTRTVNVTVPHDRSTGRQ